MFPVSQAPQCLKIHVPICSFLPEDNSIILTSSYSQGKGVDAVRSPLTAVIRQKCDCGFLLWHRLRTVSAHPHKHKQQTKGLQKFFFLCVLCPWGRMHWSDLNCHGLASIVEMFATVFFRGITNEL